MKKNLWRRRLATAMAGGAFAAVGSTALAVDFANITVVGGGTDVPAVSIDAGQGTVPNVGLGTEGFNVLTGAVAGLYPVAIGASGADDYANGIMMTSVRENGGRTDVLGNAFWATSSVATEPHQGTTAPADGTFRLVVDARANGAPIAANANLAAAYFPYSQGWVGGTTRGASNGAAPNAGSSFNGITLTDVLLGWGSAGSGINKVSIPGVADSRQQGLLFANHAKNEDNWAAVAPTPTGDGYYVSTHHGGNAGGFEPDPIAFVYIPYGTQNVTMASIHGASGPNLQPTVMNKSGNFNITRTDVGTYRLTIPGQTPTSGVLLTNSGGVISGSQTSVSDNILTYQADGDGWIIQTRDIGQATPVPEVPPFLENPTAERSQSFQFAFIPFDAPPTAPGANPTPTNLKDKILGFNLQSTEVDGTLQGAPANYGTITSATAGYRFEHLRQDRGDNSVAINGFFPSEADGIYFASVNQGFRDNTTTLGEAAYGMIAAGDGGAGWEFATHIADPGLGDASSVEFNVNFSAVFFGKDTPFQKAHNAAQVGGNLVVNVPGGNANNGVLIAQAFGNNDDYAVVTPAVDGSNWTIETYDNNTAASNNAINWIYLPYTTQNLVAGRVDPAGNVLGSTNPAGFTLVKEAGSGSYLLTIPGVTPADGTLLLTPTETTGLQDNVLVYEAAGNSFRILGVDMVSFPEKQTAILPTLEDTGFSFAFIDHDNPLAPGGGTFLAADFNQDGNVDGTDLAAWKTGFGTGTTKAQGDANGDAKVDGADFLAWQRQFGQSPAVAAGGAAAAAVPEPSSALLTIVAALGLRNVFRRRHS